MLDRDHGRVVNISSGAADRASAGWSAYCAAKAAVDQLTRVLALEMEGSGVTVCAFHPGHGDTPALDLARSSSVDALLQPARIVAYLCLPGTARNGAILEVDDRDIAREADAALA